MKPIHYTWLLGATALATPGCDGGHRSVEGAVNGSWIQVCGRVVPLAEPGAVVLAIKGCRGSETRLGRRALPPGSFLVSFDEDAAKMPITGVKKPTPPPPPPEWRPTVPPREDLVAGLQPLLPLLQANGITVRRLAASDLHQ
jgi:hypothetical protein